MAGLVLLYTAVGSQSDAQSLATELMQERLAACVNVLPGVQSYYHWQGKLEIAQEWVLLCKTPSEKIDSLWKAVQEKHPYETPCIWTLDLERVPPAYLQWAQGA